MTSLPQSPAPKLTALAIRGARGGAIRATVIPTSTTAVSPKSGQDDDGHDALTKVFLRRLSTILWIGAAGLASAGIYLLIATQGYLATSRIYIENSQPKLLADSDETVSKSDKFLPTQCSVMKSTAILNRALAAADAGRMRTFAQIGDRAQFLSDSLEIDVGKKDDIVSVSFQSPWKADAATVVNSVVQAYMDFQLDERRRTSQQVLKILRKENDKADAEVLAKRTRLAAMKNTDDAMLLQGPRNDVVFDKLTELTRQLIAAHADTARCKATYEEALAIQVDPARAADWFENPALSGAATGQDDPERQRLRTELVELELRLGVAQRQYGPSHPGYTSVQSYINEIKAKIADRQQRLLDGYVTRTRDAWTLTRNLENEQTVALKQQEQLAEHLTAKSDNYNALLYDLQAAEKRRDTLGDRIAEFTVSGDSGGMNITVLEPALPEKASPRPRKLLILLLGLAIGLAAGCGAALVHDRLDDRLKSTRAVIAATSLPVLATVPRMAGSGRKAIARHGLQLLLDPASSAAESFRSLRTAIHFGPAQDDARTLLITSAAQREGKSTTASNLAIAMAKAGQRILLIDSDFRSPRQHLIFSENKTPGLSEVVTGQATVKQAIHRTSVARLDLLPCGVLTCDPSEVLNSKRFADLLYRLASVYDHVLLDSPPVLSFTDAQVLGAVCDGTLLVVRARRSSRAAVLDAESVLVGLGARILGAVVNDVSRRERRYCRYVAGKMNGSGSKAPRQLQPGAT